MGDAEVSQGLWQLIESTFNHDYELPTREQMQAAAFTYMKRIYGEKMSEPLTDWRGQTIEVGDVILYSVKHSCEVEVNEAVVKGLRDYDDWGATKTAIQVEWIRSSDGDWARRYRKVKTVTLTNVKSVTVISKHS